MTIRRSSKLTIGNPFAVKALEFPCDTRRRWGALGFPTDLFTALFAITHTAG